MPTNDRAVLKYVQLKDLRFDPNNPRFPTSLQGASEADALTWLLRSANLSELMASIAEQDFSPGEPLLVVGVGDEPGKFMVVEGNRRFGACLLLTSPKKAPIKVRSVAGIAETAKYHPTSLPCLVFEDESKILGFLGYRHITGIQEWGPLAKARYVRRLYAGTRHSDTKALRLRAVSRRIGSRSDYVARLLTGLALYDRMEEKEFYDLPGVDEDTVPFSLLIVSLNRSPVVTFLGLSDSQQFDLRGLKERNFSDLVGWLFVKDDSKKTVLGDSRNIGDLADVVENAEALATLRRTNSLAQALTALAAGESSLSVALNEVTGLLTVVEESITEGIEAADEDLDSITEIRRLVRRIQLALEKLLDEAT